MYTDSVFRSRLKYLKQINTKENKLVKKIKTKSRTDRKTIKSKLLNLEKREIALDKRLYNYENKKNKWSQVLSGFYCKNKDCQESNQDTAFILQILKQTDPAHILTTSFFDSLVISANYSFNYDAKLNDSISIKYERLLSLIKDIPEVIWTEKKASIGNAIISNIQSG